MHLTSKIFPFIIAGALVLSACGGDDGATSKGAATGKFPILVQRTR